MLIIEKIIKQLKELDYTNEQIEKLIQKPQEFKEVVEFELGYFIADIY